VIEIQGVGSRGDAILCIHGFCCSAAIFEYAGKILSQAGYDMYSIDLPGHGRSGGTRGDLDFKDCLQSINKIVSEIRKKSSRVFILAHSMGSTFALWYAHLFRKSVDGLILLSPYIRIKGIKRSDAEPSPLAFIYLLMGRLFSPRTRVDITRVLPGYVRIGGSQYVRMTNSGEVIFQYSFRYLIDIVAQRNSMLKALADVDVPVLILYGTKDRNVYPQVSEEFFKVLKSRDKTIKSVDCNHWFYDAIFYTQSEEYREEDRRKFVSDVVGWLASH
jgi:alpha-beta hydrolase superfamily lysophospholipase